MAGSAGGRPLLIGIAGPSGSGKTRFARALAERRAGVPVAVVEIDRYYRELGHLGPEEREAFNYDHPDAIDVALLAEHLDALRDGRSVLAPTWDYARHDRSHRTVSLDPGVLVIVEGHLVLAIPALRERLDIGVYLDTPADICLTRMIDRDVAERGGSIASVLRRYRQIVRPMMLRFVEPSRAFAQLVIEFGQDLDEALDRVEAAAQALR